MEKFTRKLVLEEFDKINKGFESGVLNTVRRAMDSPEPAFIEKALKRLGRTADRHLRTVAQTAKDGIAQGQKIEDAAAAGIDYFRYRGPKAGSRKFCADRVGQVYSREEIEAMDNGQGLPVMFYGGGWNCRHRWVPISQGDTTIQIGAKPKPHEIETAKKLNKQGVSVRFVPESKEPGVKMYDAITDKTDRAEFKSAKNVKNQNNHLAARLKECEEKGANVLVLDVTQDDYDLEAAIRNAHRYAKRHSMNIVHLNQIWFLKERRIFKEII